MSYKISNSEERISIESALGKLYKFPDFHIPKAVINGLKESFVSVVTMEEPHVITHAIWGMLPEQFNGDWTAFQEAFNTLYVDENDVLKSSFFKDALVKRRCLIVASGYYTYHLNGDKIYPLHNTPEGFNTCCLAGVYNVIEDGFITCSIIKGTNDLVKSVDGKTPKIIAPQYYNSWLDKSTDVNELMHILKDDSAPKVISSNIPNDLLDYEIHFETLIKDQV